jgi:serine/threonine protein kinase
LKYIHSAGVIHRDLVRNFLFDNFRMPSGANISQNSKFSEAALFCNAMGGCDDGEQQFHRE